VAFSEALNYQTTQRLSMTDHSSNVDSLTENKNSMILPVHNKKSVASDEENPFDSIELPYPSEDEVKK
jgi:hypothetical protein